jgi:hypothetical protein
MFDPYIRDQMDIPSEIAHGTPVEIITIHVQKRRKEYIGIGLSGDQWPRVVRTSDSRFHVDDMLWMINGKEANGVQCAQRIVRKRHLTISLLRKIV